MNTEIFQLGEILRQRRQDLNFSLKEVENATSIRITYLEAIEEGELEKLISPIYAQGFIKKYAAFLEIDGESLIKEHPFFMKMLNDKQSEKQEFSFGIGTMEVRGSPGGEVKWLPNFLWVTLSVGGILAVWFLVKFFNVV